MSVETISNIERGEATTRLSTIVALADALDVRVWELFAEAAPRANRDPLVDELVELLQGQDRATLQAVLDQARILLRLTQQQ